MSEQVEARKMQLVHDLNAVIKDTQALMQAALADGKEGSEATKKSVASALEGMIERFQRMEAHADEAISHSIHRAQTYALSHPAQALGISAGIGFLMGLWMKRR